MTGQTGGDGDPRLPDNSISATLPQSDAGPGGASGNTHRDTRTKLDGGFLPDTLPQMPGIQTPDGVWVAHPPTPLATLGDYELLEELGRGGMGVVYRARQRSADRTVALKVIRPESLDRAADDQFRLVERFRTEARAAAQLDHPNIVTVYEVGEVGGQHFFSMQYVKGKSLADLVASGPLDNRRAARYLEAVARAVHQAHIRGVLHRDLKPQNILVEAETDLPLVADFGLAKLLQRDQELTLQGQAFGTPQYMSPEQSRDAAHVTTASDVYSLGATLYHLLAGRPPFRAHTLAQTLRQIQEEDPVSPRASNPAVDRDLETICLKCLEKEPARRYGSAELLAEELHRYLSGEPIQARPLGPLARTWRWCRRKPALASLGAFGVTSFLVAVAVITVGFFQARAAEERERLGYQYARGVVNELFTEVSENTLLNQPGMQPLREKLLQRALDHYEQFLALRADDPLLRDEIAQTHFRIGSIVQDLKSGESARPYYETALGMQRELLAEDPLHVARRESLGDTLNALGWVDFHTERFDLARRHYLESVEIRRRLVEQFPQKPQFRRKYANTQMNLAQSERQRGQLDEARRLMNLAQSLRRDLLVGPQTLQNLRDLAVGYYNLADLSFADGDLPTARTVLKTDAIPAFERLLAGGEPVLEDRLRLALCYRLLGDAESGLARANNGSTQAARDAFLQARSIFERLVAENPAVDKYQMHCAAVHNGIALLELGQGRTPEALAAFRQADLLLTRLVREHPRTAEYSRELAMTLGLLANAHLEAGELQLAQHALDRSIQVLAALGSEDPRDRAALENAQRLRQSIEQADAAQRK